MHFFIFASMVQQKVFCFGFSTIYSLVATTQIESEYNPINNALHLQTLNQERKLIFLSRFMDPSVGSMVYGGGLVREATALQTDTPSSSSQGSEWLGGESKRQNGKERRQH